MDGMIELTHWHWFVLGVLLLVIEVLGAPGLLLGLAFAAFTVSGLVYFELLQDWQSMLLCFGVIGFVLSFLYWKWFKSYNNKTDAPDLNNFAAQMVGTHFALKQSYSAGKHRIQIDDTVWQCQLDQDLAEGAQVEITAYKGDLLTITAV